MRSRSLIFFVLALCLGGGTAIMARSWLAQQAARAHASPMAVLPAASKPILVAATPIGRGQILRPNDFVWRKWPTDGLDRSYIQAGTRAPGSFTGWVARNAIAPGEPLTEAKIIAPGDRGFLAAVLQPGMRAVSVPVNATSGISGFIFPGDRVDILITHTVAAEAGGGSGKAAEDSHKVAETVMHNVRVIGIDQKLQGKEGEAALAHTATLEVSPKQSEIIAVAESMGKLSMSLRSLADPHRTGDRTDSQAATEKETFTLDTEVSPLLGKPLAQTENSVAVNVTILRGSGKAGQTSPAQPASRGL